MWVDGMRVHADDRPVSVTSPALREFVEHQLLHGQFIDTGGQLRLRSRYTAKAPARTLSTQRPLRGASANCAAVQARFEYLNQFGGG